MSPSKKVKHYLLCFSCLTVLFAVLIGVTERRADPSASEEQPIELQIPTDEEILTSGYPMNENGETYGPEMVQGVKMYPDLILARNREGVIGYLKSEDLYPHPTSIEEALAINDRSPYLTMYYQDGTTPIGTFQFG